MKNFDVATDRIRVTAPYALASGDGCQVGNFFGAAIKAYVLGADAILQTTGAMTFAKDGSSFIDGDRAFWDNTAKKITALPGAGNKHIGTAFAATAEATKVSVAVGMLVADEKDQTDLTGTLQTVNATPTVVAGATLPLADLTAYHVEATIVARSGANTATYKRHALVYRNGAGAVLEGTVDASLDLESAALGTADATIEVNGNNARVKVTGVAATTIQWFARLSFDKIATA